MTKEKQRYLLYDSELFYNFPFGKSEFKKLIHNIFYIDSEEICKN